MWRGRQLAWMLLMSAPWLEGCGRQVTETVFAEVWPWCWVEEDSRLIPCGLGSGTFFVDGFLAPGDSGRAMRGGTASLRIQAVSDVPRSLILEVSAPTKGGDLMVSGPRGDLLIQTRVTEHARMVSGAIPAGALTMGENLLTLQWRSSPPPAGRLAVGQGWMNQIGERGLSRADYDSAGGELHIDPGAAVECYLVPRRSARIRFDVQGRGHAAVRLACNGRETETIWSEGVGEQPRPFVVPLSAWEMQEIIGVSLTTLKEGRTVWSKVAFEGMSVPPWMVVRDHASPLRTEGGERDLNVILYVVDTVRRDHLQFHGYLRPTTPHLSATIDQWTVWEDCQSLSSWTRPSTACIQTGVDPLCHGAISEADSIRAGIDPVWTPFRQRGYEVAYLTTNSHVITRWGFARDVDYYLHAPESRFRPTSHLAADSLHILLLDWLDRGKTKGRPFFAYVHASDPHAPYTPPADLAAIFYPPDCPRTGEITLDQLRRMVCPGPAEPWLRDAAEALYDAEIAGWDKEFALLLHELSARGLIENTVIILTSDHGEEFGDHGSFSHGLTLYREQVEVPFLVRVPGVHGGRNSTPIDHRSIDDVLAAVFAGENLASWAPPGYLVRPGHLMLRNVERGRLQTDRFTLIWNVCPTGACGEPREDYELFIGDPAEIADVAADHGVLCRAGRAALDAWMRTLPPVIPVPLDAHTMNQMRLLGYVTDE